MSDLVKRLRDGHKTPTDFDHLGWTAATCGLVASAADRIEALEAVLGQAKDALSIALGDVEWRAGSPTQKVIFKSHAAIDAALKE